MGSLLKDTGYIEGETVAIEYRLAENQIERLSALATELVRRQVAAIAGPITSALVARAVTTTIPMVFVAGEDPVTLGLMTSLARPGGNVTGINIFANELAAKRLDLLRERARSDSGRRARLSGQSRDRRDHSKRRASCCPRDRVASLRCSMPARAKRSTGPSQLLFFREPPDAFFVGGDPLFGRRQ